MHPRVSIDGVCFLGEPLAADIAHWDALDVSRIGVLAAKLTGHGWEEGIGAIAATGRTVATLIHQFHPVGGVGMRAEWPAARASLLRTIDAAVRLGAESVYFTSGGRGELSWDEAADAFCEAIAPCRDAAKAAGLPLLIEPASPFHTDLNLTHNLRDTLKLAEMADLGVCIDLFACWTEADLEETIRQSMPRCGLVQVADYVAGDRSLPCRAVLGDGAIPLERLIACILDAGYKGAFDLELLGPRIDAEGRRLAVARAAHMLGTMLS